MSGPKICVWILRTILTSTEGYRLVRLQIRARHPCAPPFRLCRTDYLYFVADDQGGHSFSRTLEEHNRNVARLRRIRSGERAPEYLVAR